MTTATKAQCEYEAWATHRWWGEIKQCKLPATWVFTEAPRGTASPLRSQRHLCTRHYNAWTKGDLDAAYIEVDTPRRIAP